MKFDYKWETYKAISWAIVFTIWMVFVTIIWHYFPNSRTVYKADTFKEIKLVWTPDISNQEYWGYEINWQKVNDLCSTENGWRVGNGWIVQAKFSWNSYDKTVYCNF